MTKKNTTTVQDLIAALELIPVNLRNSPIWVNAPESVCGGASIEPGRPQQGYDTLNYAGILSVPEYEQCLLHRKNRIEEILNKIEKICQTHCMDCKENILVLKKELKEVQKEAKKLMNAELVYTLCSD